MKILTDMAALLRSNADDLDRIATNRVELRPQQLTIAEAARVLRLSLGDKCYFSVSCTLDWHEGLPPEIHWDVYRNKPDGKSFNAPTLDAAVDLVIADFNARRKSGKAQTIDQAEAALGIPEAVAEFHDPTSSPESRQACAAAVDAAVGSVPADDGPMPF